MRDHELMMTTSGCGQHFCFHFFIENSPHKRFTENSFLLPLLYFLESTLVLSLPLLSLNVAVSLAQAIDVQRGASLFGRSCIGCHDGGGNIIQPVRSPVIDDHSCKAITSFFNPQLPCLPVGCNTLS